MRHRAPRHPRTQQLAKRLHHGKVQTTVSAKRRKSLVNAQDVLMIGKTPRAVAVKYARPTTPRTANVAKDIFSMVIPRVCRLSFGLMGCVFHFSEQQ